MLITMELIKKIQAFSCDINHYDSDDFTPPESVAEILNDFDVVLWLDSMLKHCTCLTLSKLEEIAEEEK